MPYYIYRRQISRILNKISQIDCSQYENIQQTSGESFENLYMQLSLQPVKFTIAGFYTINLQFLASVSPVNI